jgi:hypothetical protein
MANEFPIKIRTDLDGKGLKEASAEFADLQKETKLADEQLKQTVVTHEDVGKKAEESGKKQVEHAEKATLSHRELRESVSAVGRQFGGLADVGLWLNPMTAGLAAVLALVGLLKSAIDFLAAPIEAANAALVAMDASRIKSAAESASALATSLGEIPDKESAIQAAFARGTTAMDNRIKLYDEQRAGIVKVAEAEEKAFEAELEHKVVMGSMTKEQADAAKEQAKLALDSLRGQNDEAKLQFEIQQRLEAFNAAKVRTKTGVDTNAIATAEGALAGPKSDADAAKAALNIGQNETVHHGFFGDLKLDEAKKKLLELTETLRETKPNDANANILIEKKYQAEQLAAEIKAHEAKMKPLEEAANAADVAQKHAEQNVKNAKDQEEADAKLAIEGAARIKSLQDELAILQQTNTAVQAANTRAAGSRTAGAADTGAQETFHHAQELEKHLAEHGGTRAEFVELNALMARLVEFARTNADYIASHAHTIADLKRQVDGIEQVQHQTGNVR